MERLKVLREQRGLSREILAAEADVSPVTIWRYETGKRSPNVEALEKLALAMGTEVADFFPKAQAPLFDPGPTEEGLRYLRAWRGFAWDLALYWGEKPPQSSSEIAPLLAAVSALVDAGVFEDSADDTSTRGELSLFRLALAKLAKIADEVENHEVADELRGTLALVPNLRDRHVA
jgi:transcriptional regulator with XRE-family HTH domain